MIGELKVAKSARFELSQLFGRLIATELLLDLLKLTFRHQLVVLLRFLFVRIGAEIEAADFLGYKALSHVRLSYDGRLLPLAPSLSDLFSNEFHGLLCPLSIFKAALLPRCHSLGIAHDLQSILVDFAFAEVFCKSLLYRIFGDFEFVLVVGLVSTAYLLLEGVASFSVEDAVMSRFHYLVDVEASAIWTVDLLVKLVFEANKEAMVGSRGQDLIAAFEEGLVQFLNAILDLLLVTGLLVHVMVFHFALLLLCRCGWRILPVFTLGALALALLLSGLHL